MELVSLCFASIFATSAIVVVNKAIVDELSTLAGTFLVPLHNVCVILFTARKPSEGPIALHLVLACAILSVVNFVATNVVLKFSTVSFQQVSRLLAIPMGVAVDYWFWCVPLPGSRRLAYVFGMAASGVAVLYEEQKLSLVAVCGSLVTTVSQVACQMVTKAICRRHGVTAMEVVRVTAPYTLATSLLTIIVSSCVSGGGLQLPSARIVEDVMKLSSSGWSLVMLSCLLALVVQYLSTYLSNACTGLSYALLTLAKTLCTVCFGMVVFSESIGTEKMAGSLVTLGLFSIYLIDPNTPRLKAVETHVPDASVRASLSSWRTRSLTAAGVALICLLTSLRLNRQPTAENDGSQRRLLDPTLPGRLEELGTDDRAAFLAATRRSTTQRSAASKTRAIGREDRVSAVPAALSRSKNFGRELERLGSESRMRPLRKKSFTLHLLPEHEHLMLTRRLELAKFKYNPIIYQEKSAWKCDKYVAGLATHVDPSLDNVHHYLLDELLPHFLSAFELNRRGDASDISIVLAGKVGWQRGIKFNMTTSQRVVEQIAVENIRMAFLRSVLEEYCSGRSCTIYAGYERPETTICFERLMLSFETAVVVMDALPRRVVLRAFDALHKHLLRIGGAKADTGDATIKRAVIHTRFDANTRRIVNWQEVKAHLEGRGYLVTVVHDIANTAFREIVSIFSSADLFIVPGGSSVINMLLMKPGSTFIESSACCSRWSAIYDLGWIDAKRMSYGYMPSMECEERKCNAGKDGVESTMCGSRGNIECPTLHLDVRKIDEILTRIGKNESFVDLGVRGPQGGHVRVIQMARRARGGSGRRFSIPSRRKRRQQWSRSRPRRTPPRAK